MAEPGGGGAGVLGNPVGNPGGNPGPGPDPAIPVNQAYSRGRAIPADLGKGLQGVSKLLTGRPDDASYTRWEDVSLQIGHWLTLQVNESLQTQLYNGSATIKYADEVFIVIRALAVGSGAVQLKVAVLRAT
ncbi:hypothetical protein BJX65DRAFT_312435 [Aspergillus insuetus]